MEREEERDYNQATKHMNHLERERERKRPGASILKELAGGGEDDEGHVSIAKNGEFLSFLEESSPPLGEGHLPRRRVVDFPDLNLLPRHFFFSFSYLIN